MPVTTRKPRRKPVVAAQDRPRRKTPLPVSGMVARDGRDDRIGAWTLGWCGEVKCMVGLRHGMIVPGACGQVFDQGVAPNGNYYQFVVDHHDQHQQDQQQRLRPRRKAR